jgi:hypothetical protein
MLTGMVSGDGFSRKFDVSSSRVDFVEWDRCVWAHWYLMRAGFRLLGRVALVTFFDNSENELVIRMEAKTCTLHAGMIHNLTP